MISELINLDFMARSHDIISQFEEMLLIPGRGKFEKVLTLNMEAFSEN